jgi:hypothetical protein
MNYNNVKQWQDRVRLSRPKEEDGEAKEAAPEAEKISFNKWEATNFGSSAQNEKFRRLMGIKTNKPPEVRKINNIQNVLENRKCFIFWK